MPLFGSEHVEKVVPLLLSLLDVLLLLLNLLLLLLDPLLLLPH